MELRQMYLELIELENIEKNELTNEQQNRIDYLADELALKSEEILKYLDSFLI